jgi:recombinational DNA repair ATPase RecF
VRKKKKKKKPKKKKKNRSSFAPLARSHKNTCVALGAQINFITGVNGSGKSALLHAISVGLGSRGNFSHKGGNLRLLIREGANTARIKIYLRNRVRIMTGV